jgi:hypothetical protein
MPKRLVLLRLVTPQNALQHLVGLFDIQVYPAAVESIEMMRVR